MDWAKGRDLRTCLIEVYWLFARVEAKVVVSSTARYDNCRSANGVYSDAYKKYHGMVRNWNASKKKKKKKAEPSARLKPIA
jgi:hypothetical protein